MRWVLLACVMVLLAGTSGAAAQGGASVTVEPAIVTTGQPYTVTACGLTRNGEYFTVVTGDDGAFEYHFLTGGDKCETWQQIGGPVVGQHAIVLYKAQQGGGAKGVAEQFFYVVAP